MKKALVGTAIAAAIVCLIAVQRKRIQGLFANGKHLVGGATQVAADKVQTASEVVVAKAGKVAQDGGLTAKAAL